MIDRNIFKVIDTENRNTNFQAGVNVPEWFLDGISESSTQDEVDTWIKKMENSDEDSLIKDKSIHLAKVRKKIILEKLRTDHINMLRKKLRKKSKRSK